MNKRIKKLWVNALRSGKYKQGTGQLRRDDPKDGSVHCCLGVLCELARQKGVIETFDGVDGDLPPEVAEWARLEDSDPTIGPESNDFATYLNDNVRLSFQRIAARIEKYL